MIIIVDGLNRHQFSNLLDDMFRLRARVFGERLGWDVNIVDGKEIDDFDNLDPAYVIGVDDEGHVVAAVRALQTTGPHMLADVFSKILDGEPPLRSATLWESTRFCVDTKRLAKGKDRNSISYATSELMIGSLEYAQRSGIQDIVTVIDPIMNRVLKRSDNAPYDYVGKTVSMGKVPALAALLDCTDERIQRVRDFAGIHHDVLIPEDEAIGRFGNKAREPLKLVSSRAESAAPATGNPEDQPLGKLEQYLADQMRSAATEAERQAVVDLIDALSEMVTPEQREKLSAVPARILKEA